MAVKRAQSQILPNHPHIERFLRGRMTLQEHRVEDQILIYQLKVDFSDIAG